MENIIKKAVKGGYSWWTSRYPTLTEIEEERIKFLLEDYEKPSYADLVCDPLFFQALGKSCGWYNHTMRGSRGECLECGAPQCDIEWKTNALHFHEINLTESFESAVKWLEELVK